jgi:hypothetical protein
VGDGHDYEIQENWNESPSNECYSHYQSNDPVGSSEDDDEDEDEDPLYEPVRLIILSYPLIKTFLHLRVSLCSTMTDFATGFL